MPDKPIAYLITFRCYGTWLHGDRRGSTDRRHNLYGTPHIAENRRWHAHNLRALKHEPVALSPEQRKCVEDAIQETCLFRNWDLHAVNVRPNHAHSVVTAYMAPNNMSVPFAVANGLAEAIPPERVLNALKANGTRYLREAGQWEPARTPWADGGSRRYLWSEFQLQQAKDYVLNCQGGPIPEFHQRNRLKR